MYILGKDIKKIAHDSREVEPGTLFFAITGYQSDGHDYAAAALAAGAVSVVAEHEIAGIDSDKLIIVPNTRVALAHAAVEFYNNPGRSLAITGITGTNGKTTTIYLCDAIARAAGEQSAVIGTVESKYALQPPGTDEKTGEHVQDSQVTTPDALALQALLAQMRDAGVQSVAMEVSSHAIDLHRVDELPFAVAAFTNLSQDHLDYHPTMEAYQAVKERLFTDFEVEARVINVDDAVGADIAARLQAAGVQVTTVGMSCDNPSNAEPLVRAVDCRATARGTDFTLHMPDGSAPVMLPLMGDYNVSNALVAAGCAWARGIDTDTIARGLSAAPQVPGRLELVCAGQPFAVAVDYAHTPDALQTALAALRRGCNGRLISVFGCGGDRDPLKRPLMARAAGEGSDVVIATSDNPRSEDPDDILRQVLDGLVDCDVEYEALVDRRAAIERAIRLARSGDCVLIAGKGHEDYQIFADGTIHFDDREAARDVLASLGFEQGSNQEQVS